MNFRKIVNLTTWFFLNIFTFQKYISDLRTRLIKSEVEWHEGKSCVVKYCQQVRVKLTKTTWPTMNITGSPIQVWALLVQLTFYP